MPVATAYFLSEAGFSGHWRGARLHGCASADGHRSDPAEVEDDRANDNGHDAGAHHSDRCALIQLERLRLYFHWTFESGVQRQIGEHFRVLVVVWHAEVDEVAIGLLDAAEVVQRVSFLGVPCAEFRARRRTRFLRARRFAAIENHGAVLPLYYGRLRSNGRTSTSTVLPSRIHGICSD
jgi:hypothetical protein